MIVQRLLRISAVALGISTAVWSHAGAAPFQCPQKGGDLVWAVSADVPGLDIHATGAQATRDIGMNVFETLVTRDEHFGIMPELAQSYDVSPDGLKYTFKLRPGIKFHNGKTVTAADVKASFERFGRLAPQKKLDQVASMDAVDDLTFVVTMKQPVPTFLESISAFANVIAIMPADTPEHFGTDAFPIGTGPYRFVEWVPDSHVKIARFDAYQPDTRYADIDGYGGYKVACLDTITYKIVPEAGARVAGMEAGEFDGADAIPTLSKDRLAAAPGTEVVELKDFWLDYAVANLKVPPTDNLKFRQAVQAAINVKDIMEIATDGLYSLFPGIMYPYQDFYSDVGREHYNVADPALAKRLLTEAGYKGEKVVLATNNQYSDMNKAAIVMAEQLKAVGVNVDVSVTDWPTFLKRRFGTDYNYFFGAQTTAPNGPVDAASPYSPPRNFQNNPNPDPAMAAAWDKLNTSSDTAIRKAAFADMQKQIFDQAYALPFGTMTQLQAVRSNVKNYRPFRSTRMSNVYLAN